MLSQSAMTTVTTPPAIEVDDLTRSTAIDMLCTLATPAGGGR
jgi:hypothetical protein